MIKAQCQEMTGEKEVFLDVDGRQTEKKMLGEVGCQTSNAATGNVCRPTVVSQNDGTSSWCDDADRSRRRLTGRQHEPADSGMVARDHVAPETS